MDSHHPLPLLSCFKFLSQGFDGLISLLMS
jgi:hypothetical protein